jgi:hypothetical protein
MSEKSTLAEAPVRVTLEERRPSSRANLKVSSAWLVGFRKVSEVDTVAMKSEPAVMTVGKVVVQDAGSVGAGEMVTEVGEPKKLWGLELPPVREMVQSPTNGILRAAVRAAEEAAMRLYSTEPVMVEE